MEVSALKLKLKSFFYRPTSGSTLFQSIFSFFETTEHYPDICVWSCWLTLGHRQWRCARWRGTGIRPSPTETLGCPPRLRGYIGTRWPTTPYWNCPAYTQTPMGPARPGYHLRRTSPSVNHKQLNGVSSLSHWRQCKYHYLIAKYCILWVMLKSVSSLISTRWDTEDIQNYSPNPLTLYYPKAQTTLE